MNYASLVYSVSMKNDYSLTPHLSYCSLTGLVPIVALGYLLGRLLIPTSRITKNFPVGDSRTVRRLDMLNPHPNPILELQNIKKVAGDVAIGIWHTNPLAESPAVSPQGSRETNNGAEQKEIKQQGKETKQDHQEPKEQGKEAKQEQKETRQQEKESKEQQKEAQQQGKEAKQEQRETKQQEKDSKEQHKEAKQEDKKTVPQQSETKQTDHEKENTPQKT